MPKRHWDGHDNGICVLDCIAAAMTGPDKIAKRHHILLICYLYPAAAALNLNASRTIGIEAVTRKCCSTPTRNMWLRQETGYA